MKFRRKKKKRRGLMDAPSAGLFRMMILGDGLFPSDVHGVYNKSLYFLKQMVKSAGKGLLFLTLWFLTLCIIGWIADAMTYDPVDKAILITIMIFLVIAFILWVVKVMDEDIKRRHELEVKRRHELMEEEERKAYDKEESIKRQEDI